MKIIEITLQGVTPLLINRFSDESEIPAKVSRGKKDYGTPRIQAEKTAYFDKDSTLLWIPSSWITGAINAISSDYKLTGSRKSLKSVIGGAVVPLEEKIYFQEKYKLKNIEIDSRPVVIQRARIMRHRTRLEKWNLAFCLEIDEGILPVDQFHQIIVDAGRRAGLGDYRPPKGGPFGKFIVSRFHEIKGKDKHK